MQVLLIIGADLRAKDGVYSRYFTEFDSDGTYSVRVEVIGENGQVQLYKETRSYGSGAPPLPEYRGKERYRHTFIFRMYKDICSV